MKASTTTFYELITHHPAIWFSSEKEPHYFTAPNYGERAAWEDYLKLFDAAPPTAQYIGEASTGYTKLPHLGDTPRRLHESLTDPRLIYLVRDPVQRTISNYQHSYLSGHYATGTTLGEAIAADPILIDASCYARQIRAYWDVFSKQQLLILATDQLHAEPTQVMRRVETFLGLPSYDGWETTLPQSNSQQALRSSLKLHSLLPKPLLDGLRKLLPAGVRNRLKSLAASAPSLPPIAVSDRQLIWDRIADDLRDFVQLADEELAVRISDWPSVRQLGEG
jgi:hypothetical protein